MRVGAGQENLWSSRFLADIDNVGADPVAGVEVFARDRFVSAQQRFGAAQIDDDVSVLDALDQAVDDFTDAVLVFLELTAAFGVAHPLHDHLLGRLRGDASEVDRRQGID